MLGAVLAVILASDSPARLYTGLSLLVSTAAEGEPAYGLATFGALELLLADPGADSGRGELFDRTLAELRATAGELEDCRLWACAAAVETSGLEPGDRFEGVLSTPRFLRMTRDARLVVV